MTATPLRCAIYTRKSSEEGLDQTFNSLHAQREACEAYVKSQAGEGWRALRTAYDDGAVSGGHMDRDGLKTLLADVEAGKIDVVVVYKVDRLTRSLADFARIVDVFDQRGVSFVSVTQAFNTTTSMGRLTLNVLLSFAQFEREVTGERIRDKIAQSKAKGLWMGGRPPLGYDPDGRSLKIVPAEADLVRLIFQRYLELRSVHRLCADLAAKGVVSKTWVTAKGRTTGGLPFNRGALFHLLKNPIYIGKIVHKDLIHPGNHLPIVELATFEATQRLLSTNTVLRPQRPPAIKAMLSGLLHDAEGNLMSPTASRGKGGATYRYYVSAPLQQGRAKPVAGDAILRIPAAPMERWLTELLDRLAPGAPLTSVQRIDVRPQAVELCLDIDALGESGPERRGRLEALAKNLRAGERTIALEGRILRLHLPYRLKFRGGCAAVATPDGKPLGRSQHDLALIRALKSAHAFVTSSGGAQMSRAPESYHTTKLVRLAFLAPDLQEAILQGRQPLSLNLERLKTLELPPAWEDQRKLFGWEVSTLQAP